MIKQELNIIWLKRDLRTQDHAPLQQAEKANTPYLIIYIFEPSIFQHPDTSLRHLRFIFHSIKGLNRSFKKYNRNVETFYGEAIDIFNFLLQKFHIKNIFSHQENGIQITWNRDIKVAKLFTKKKINWIQYQRDGILRGIKNRKNWNKEWHTKMHQPTIFNTYSLNQTIINLKHKFKIPQNFYDKLVDYPIQYQPAGERYAWLYLKSFVEKRGFNYHKKISKPTESRISCSRLSPYLAWGNISIKQVFQFVGTHPNGTNNDNAFSGMLTRLHWHCHFIQKFEMAPSYETKCINKGYEILHHDKNTKYIDAWKKGQTGYPLIDACMRALIHTGWINFRMRAMLVSFFTLNLDQDWRDGVYHLANLFLDYDPGIHYPQFQMQAGTTGINTVRLYNPVKNSLEHDKNGEFIKKWIPELAKVPIAYIHEPWKMSYMEQTFCNTFIGEDYPQPIVDLKKSARLAREKIWTHKNHPLVQQEKNKILNTHVNRRN